MTTKAPLGARLLLKDRPDWDALTEDQVIVGRAKLVRLVRSPVMRLIAGLPDRRAGIEEHTLDLPGRDLTLRVHRPKGRHDRLPLVLSFHGGGFITGTAAQNDWLNSRLAARLPAVVVAVEYRLAPEHPLPAPVEDACETLDRLADDPFDWGLDPHRIAVLGESAGGALAALLALRSRETGPAISAQVLVYPALDWTATMTDHPSVARNIGQPGLSAAELGLARRIALPPDFDPDLVSPLKSADLTGLPPALAVAGELDPVYDHGRAYVERLRAAGNDARFTGYPNAVHKFISIPSAVPAARPARREILDFLRARLRATAPAR
ncbi:alpha/beta hydrolase [Glycomyces tritici]|uniref:Alpha/beta hydrolase n=1 Tax=Glycomyces tritici TaxID=2665176 RepID=A0ABT7YLQ2_9ACTN|nr:alpha/beta hydrolase [Glycomyces tritici]MDN3239556.1 alpha/beta hydrolase [Glycomyces tritici]